MARGTKTGGGSRLGKPNKLTMAAKEAFQYAFDGIGGQDALAKWGRDNQTEFYKLFARLIPVQQDMSLNITQSADKLSDDQLAAIAAGKQPKE